MPRNLIKSFNLDLAAGGVPNRDKCGRTVYFHAVRRTFGTHLSKNGVPPRTAQAAMRHSSLDLTMNVYMGDRSHAEPENLHSSDSPSTAVVASVTCPRLLAVKGRTLSPR